MVALMKTLSVLLTSFLVLISTSAFAAGTCDGRCMNIGGNPSNDRFCENIAGSGGDEVACNHYSGLGCAWIKPPSPTQGVCVNATPNGEYDAVCYTAGKNDGQAGCARYAGLGCVWSTSPVHCE